MYYILLNLKGFAGRNRLMFLMLVLMQIFSCVSVLFAYGVYNNFRYERSSELADTTAITINFDESVRFTDIREAMNEVPQDILTESASIMLSTKYYIDGSSVINEPLVDEMKEWETDGSIQFGVPQENIASILISMKYDAEEGQYIYLPEDYEVYSENTLEGSFIAQEDYSSGERVLAYCKGGPLLNYTVGSVVSFCGEEYTVCARYRTLHEIKPNRLDLSFYAAPDDMRVMSLNYYFEGFVPKKSYNAVTSIFTDCFGKSVTIPEPPEIELDDHNYYTTVMAIALMFIIVPAINFGILFCYIVSLRSRMIAVFRIEGGTRRSSLKMFLVEYLIISCSCFGVGSAVFRFALYPALKEHFLYFESIYSTGVYLVTFAAYTVLTAIVSLIMINRVIAKTPSAQIKGVG
ncbi:MAG: ABC transporter permease [Ruminococcus sp.]|nr:ABC transporter permease [Ruminococcus sp.]